MPALPKPQPCGQPWLDMMPTEKGRRCGQCEKVIYDFSAMSWPDIARTQQAHGNTLCGMYAPAQLTHWGQEPPRGACARLAAATTLALSLASISAPAQPAASPAAGITISGQVTARSAQGKPEPVPFASVLLQGTDIGALTDEQGHYQLVVPNLLTAPTPVTLTFHSLGFEVGELPLPLQSPGLIHHDVELVVDPNRQLTTFSVRQPTKVERVKWGLKRWFGR
jgi:hypothetical protein